MVVDTQPVRAWPPVTTPGGTLGKLDLRGWRAIVEAVDDRVERVIDEGLFASETRTGFVVTDMFDSGPAVLETLKDWQGTRVPDPLADRLASHRGPAMVHQDVRFRLL